MAGAGVVHVPQRGQDGFRVFLLGNHAEAVHLEAVIGGVAFRGAAGGESEQARAVKTDDGVFKLREGEGKSLRVACVVAAEHEPGLGSAAGFEDEVTRDVDDGIAGAGTQLRFQRCPGKALIGQKRAVDGAVGLGIGGVVHHRVELGDDAGQRGQAAIALRQAHGKHAGAGPVRQRRVRHMAVALGGEENVVESLHHIMMAVIERGHWQVTQCIVQRP